MSPAQKEAYAQMVDGPRGRLPMPYRMWLASAQLVKCLEPLGVHFRNSSLTLRETEMVILVTGQAYGSPFELAAHRKLAASVGLEPAVIDALCAGETPPLTDEREKVVYETARALHQMADIPDALYDRAIATLGHEVIADMTVLIGYYVAAAHVLKFYRVPLPA
jgi:4-carboxymuconolactone decarboxylase